MSRLLCNNCESTHGTRMSRFQNVQQTYTNPFALICVATGAAVVTGNLVYAEEDHSTTSPSEQTAQKKMKLLEQWQLEGIKLVDNQRVALRQLDSMVPDLLKVAGDWPVLSGMLAALDERVSEVKELERRTPGSTETLYGLQPWYRRSVISGLVANAVGVSAMSSAAALLAGQTDVTTAALIGLGTLGVQLLTTLAMGYYWLSPPPPQQPQPLQLKQKEEVEEEGLKEMYKRTKREEAAKEKQSTEELKKEFKEMMTKDGISPVGDMIMGMISLNEMTLALNEERLTEEDKERLKKANELARSYVDNLKRLAALHNNLQQTVTTESDDLTKEEKEALHSLNEELLNRLFGYESNFDERWGERLADVATLTIIGASVFKVTCTLNFDLQQRIEQAKEVAAVPLHRKGITLGLLAGTCLGALPLFGPASHEPQSVILPLLVASGVASYLSIQCSRFWSLLLFQMKTTEKALKDVAKHKKHAADVIELTKEVTQDAPLPKLVVWLEHMHT